MKSSRTDLTQGGILSKLIFVALPVMGTQLMNMLYNLTDMFWVGKLGSDSVAATGTAGMYIWLSMAFMFIGRMGSEIGVSQNLGRGDKKTALSFSTTSLMLAAFLGISYTLIVEIFCKQLVGFFNIREQNVVAETKTYLYIVALGVTFTFIASCITGIYSASGNTRIPFYFTATGLLLNIILDPVLILALGMGVAGAAIATVFAQMVVCTCLVIHLRYGKTRPFRELKLIVKPNFELLPQIFKWGIPVCLESMLFTVFSMLVQRIITNYGASALAVSRIGGQIESLTWLIAGGYSTALTAFVGQNFGAGKWTRIHKGYKLSLLAMTVWGTFVTIVVIVFAKQLFSIFISEPKIIELGIDYLQILAFCQLACCVEMMTGGAFRGVGKPLPPSICSISFNGARVVLAYAWAQTGGLNAIWWAVTIGAVCRGVSVLVWYIIVNAKTPKTDTLPEPQPQN